MLQPLSSSSGGAAVAEATPFPIFVDTSLETHLAVVISPDVTILDLKRKVAIEHASCFPEIGDITILAIKVKRKAALYRLSESMKVRDAFMGMKGSRFLHVDAARSVDIKTSAPVDGLAEAVKSDVDGNVKLASPSVHKELSSGSFPPSHNIEKIPGSEFQATERDKPAADLEGPKGVKIADKDLNHFLSGKEIRVGSGIVEHGLIDNADILTKSDRMVELEGNDTRIEEGENLIFDAEKESGEVPSTSNKHTKRAVDSASDEKKKKKRKKLKRKKNAEGVNTQLGTAGIESNKYDQDMETVSGKKSPSDIQKNVEGSLVDLVDQFKKTKETTEGTTDCNVKKQSKKQTEKNYAEDCVEAQTEVAEPESNELKPSSENAVEMVPRHADDNNLEILVTKKKRRKKSKGKNSVEIQPQSVGSKSNEPKPNLEKMAEATESNAGELVANPLEFNEKNVCSSPKKLVQRKRKKGDRQVDHEPSAEANENPHESEEQIIEENSKLENIKVSGKEFNSKLVDGAPKETITSKDIDSGPSSKKKVKKSRHKQSLDCDEEQTPMSMTERVAYVEIPTIDGHPKEFPTSIDDHSVQKLEVVLGIGESIHKVANDVHIKAGLVGSSNVNNSCLVEPSTDFIVGSSWDSSNKNLVSDGSLSLKEGEEARKENDRCFTGNVAGEVLADMHCEVQVTKSKYKRPKKPKESVNPVHDAGNDESKKLKSFKSVDANTIDLQSNKEQSLNIVSRDPVDANSGKPQNGSKKRSHSSKLKPPKIPAPEYDKILSSRTHSAKQVTEDNVSDAVLSQKATREDNKKDREIIDSSEMPKFLDNTNCKASRHHKKAKNDHSNQGSIGIGGIHSSEHQVNRISLENDCQELQKISDRGIAYENAADSEKMGQQSANSLESSEKKHRRNKKKTGKFKPSDPNSSHSEVTFAGKQVLPASQDVAGLDSSNKLEDIASCTVHGKLDSTVPDSIAQNGNVDCSHHFIFLDVKKQGNDKHPVEESGASLVGLKSPSSRTAEAEVVGCPVSPGSEVQKHNIVSRTFCARPEEMTTDVDAGKEQKLKFKISKGKKKSTVCLRDLSYDSENAINSPDSGLEKLQYNVTMECSTEEPKAVTECTDGSDRGEKSDTLHSGNLTDRNKRMEADELLSEKFNDGSYASQPSVRMESIRKEIANDVASSDSTEEDNLCNTGHYRVSVRKDPHKRAGNSSKDPNKGYFAAKGDIFDDNSSSSSEGSLQSKALEGYHSGSFSSASDVDLDDTPSQASGKVIDYRANTQRGGTGNEAQVPKLDLGTILRNSSTYRKAKVLTSQQDDSESQHADVVPETQPE